jgi:hypothetical protein
VTADRQLSSKTLSLRSNDKRVPKERGRGCISSWIAATGGLEMPAAKSLGDLLRIRNENRQYLDSIKGNLGSALGFKKRTGYAVSDEPAVLIFVRRKIDSKWLPEDQVIKPALKGPDNLTCPLDVVEGNRQDMLVEVVDEVTKEEFPFPWSALQGPAPLSAEQLRLREKLLGWSKKIMPGAQIGGKDSKNREFTGALGFFAKRDHTLGFVTNQHVADKVKSVLYFPWFGARACGVVKQTVDTIPASNRFDGLITDENAFYKVDCAFVALHDDEIRNDIDVRLPLIGRSGDLSMKQIGKPIDLDLNSMCVLGQKVMSIGPKRSLQRGTIYGFAYEYKEEDSKRYYTDYLIVGDNDKEFSWGGDSGKLIFTDDVELRPIALLWGGRTEQIRPEHGQEKWAYAIDINLVLHSLHVDFASQDDVRES